MSLGPTTSVSSNRLSQSLRTPLEETRKTEAQAPVTPSTATAGTEGAPFTPAVDPAIQVGAREATKGAEDAIRSRLDQIMEGPAGGAAPRRGLGGNSLEGEQFVNKRTGRGRRTAGVETGVQQQLARAASDAPTPATTLQDPFEMAGKRTTSGTRMGSIDTDGIPGLPGGKPPTGFA